MTDDAWLRAKWTRKSVLNWTLTRRGIEIHHGSNADLTRDTREPSGLYCSWVTFADAVIEPGPFSWQRCG
jgi:hypothetical protein